MVVFFLDVLKAKKICKLELMLYFNSKTIIKYLYKLLKKTIKGEKNAREIVNSRR